MTRTFYPGGSYVDALPSGAFAVLFAGSHLQTHQGRIDLPTGDEPLYHRITEVGGFRIAGQAHASARTLEWDGSWRGRPVACGVSPVIYDLLGVLHISHCGPVGSQGYRYVTADNELVTGDATYGSSVGLSEWSAVDGLMVGQGHDGGGCLVWDGAVLRELEAGDCTFVRVQGDGARVAISFRKPDGAVIYQTTAAELRALPPRVLAPTPPTAPPVTPPPPIVPPTPPEPTPVSIPNQLSTVQRIRAKYPTPLGAQHPAFLIEVAQATGAKLLRKDGGTHVTLPTGVNVSQDILMFLDQGVDILSDAEGAAVASWQEKGTIAGEYVDVGGIPAPGQPPPVTPPPPAPPAKNYDADIAALQAEIDAIRQRLDALPPPSPAPDLSGYAKKGDTVTVNAKVFGYALVGHGSIDK